MDKIHYTQRRALEKLGYNSMGDFAKELEYLTYEKRMPLADICKMFPQVSDTFIRNFEGWIDFIYLTDDEVNNRIRETYNNPEKREKILNKISNSLIGQKRSEEAKRHIKEGAIKRGISQETRNKMNKSMKKVWASKEYKEKCSKRMKNFFANMTKDERREYVKPFIEAGINCRTSNTSIELKVKKQLDEMNIRYIQQKDLCNHKFYVDFYIPSLKLVIECNGDYWHNLPERKQRDKELKEYVESTGRKIIFIWEHEIKDDWFWIGDYISELMSQERLRYSKRASKDGDGEE